MPGRLLRSVCTAAVATAAVAAVLPGGIGAARAEPVPGPAVSAPAETGPGSGDADAVGPGASAGSGDGDATGPADGAPAGVPEALNRLRELYHRAEDAGAAHLAAGERLREQRAETARLGRELTRAREALTASRGEAGRLAREQYQGRSELSAYLRILLARDPRRALDQEHLLERAAAHRMATTVRLARTAKRAASLARRSRQALDRERTLTVRRERALETASSRLRAVEEMLASLSPAEITALTSPGVGRTLAGPPGGPAHSTRTDPPTERGAAAVRYAVEQIGKPYVWGAAGPAAYDCSGLTSRAWQAAGLGIPRTSQEQWDELSRVPLRALRPGDLVVYFPEATHVGLYLGDGLVVHAPRPGAVVKVSPLTANPVLGAVRPDPEGAPLARWTPPRLPEGATAGTDTGYAGTEAPA